VHANFPSKVVAGHSLVGFIVRHSIRLPMASVEEVKHRHEFRLMKTPGVVGVGLGRKDGKDCIRIYVKDDNPKTLAALPQTLEDVPVEIVVSGTFKAL